MNLDDQFGVFTPTQEPYDVSKRYLGQQLTALAEFVYRLHGILSGSRVVSAPDEAVVIDVVYSGPITDGLRRW